MSYWQEMLCLGFNLRTFVLEPVESDKSFFLDSFKKLTANWMNREKEGNLQMSEILLYFINILNQLF